MIPPGWVNLGSSSGEVSWAPLPPGKYRFSPRYQLNRSSHWELCLESWWILKSFHMWNVAENAFWNCQTATYKNRKTEHLKTQSFPTVAVKFLKWRKLFFNSNHVCCHYSVLCIYQTIDKQNKFWHKNADLSYFYFIFGHMNTKYPCRPKKKMQNLNNHYLFSIWGYSPSLNSLESTSYC